MTVEQVYKNMDSDYASVKDRLQNDALIRSFSLNFSQMRAMQIY